MINNTVTVLSWLAPCRRGGRRIVGYDNERGKGDHRYRHGREDSYRFTTVEQLVSDFLADVAEERGS